jgi:hypothetical protein
MHCKLCFASTLYHLWRQRNDLCNGNTPRTEERIEAQTKCEVRARIRSVQEKDSEECSKCQVSSYVEHAVCAALSVNVFSVVFCCYRSYCVLPKWEF